MTIEERDPTPDSGGAQDWLASTVSIESSLAGLHATQMECLHEFLLAYVADIEVVALSGRERMVRYGGAGTPEVPEFALAQVQAEMGLSTWAAQKLVADTLSLIYRLPKVFAALKDGTVRDWRARMAASATRDLSLAQVAPVDDRLASGHPHGDPLLARMGRKRLSEVIDQVVGTSDPEAAEDEVAAALADRHLSIRPGSRGVSDVFGTVSSVDGVRLEELLQRVAGWLAELGDDRPVAVLRSVALGMLADPGSLDRLRAQVHAHRTGQDPADETDETEGAVTGAAGQHAATVLYVHFDRASDTWSLDGQGPLTRSEAEDLVGHGAVTVKPVIDLAENLSYTGYVAPPRLKEQLALTNAGRCTFPHCDRPAGTGDYDHVVNYDPNAPPGTAGATDSRNGHRPCRFHHRVKTHTPWWVESPSPGIWLWHGPRGDAYLVTAGTTTRLR